jgi:predicted GIY-YIG superfamily endonuclease
MAFCVYILASQRNGTLYTGHTENIHHRMWEHRNEMRRGFTSKYGVKMLVWYEWHETRQGAFARERAIKKWYRAWKIEMIERFSPGWRDLYDELQPN